MTLIEQSLGGTKRPLAYGMLDGDASFVADILNSTTENNNTYFVEDKDHESPVHQTAKQMFKALQECKVFRDQMISTTRFTKLFDAAYEAGRKL